MRRWHALLGCLKDLLREVLSTDIATNGNSITTSALDLINDLLRPSFIKATETLVEEEAKNRHATLTRSRRPLRLLERRVVHSCVQFPA